MLRKIISKLTARPAYNPNPYHLGDELLAAVMDCLTYTLADRGDSIQPASLALRKSVHAQRLDINQLGLRDSLDTLEYVIQKLKDKC